MPANPYLLPLNAPTTEEVPDANGKTTRSMIEMYVVPTTPPPKVNPCISELTPPPEYLLPLNAPTAVAVPESNGKTTLSIVEIYPPLYPPAINPCNEELNV